MKTRWACAGRVPMGANTPKQRARPRRRVRVYSSSSSSPDAYLGVRHSSCCLCLVYPRVSELYRSRTCREQHFLLRVCNHSHHKSANYSSLARLGRPTISYLTAYPMTSQAGFCYVCCPCLGRSMRASPGTVSALSATRASSDGLVLGPPTSIAQARTVEPFVRPFPRRRPTLDSYTCHTTTFQLFVLSLVVSSRDSSLRLFGYLARSS